MGPLDAEGDLDLTPSPNTGLELAAAGPYITAHLNPAPGAPPRQLVKALGALARKVEEHEGILLAMHFPNLPTMDVFPPALMRRVQQIAGILQRQGGFLVVSGPVPVLEKALSGGIPICLVASTSEAENLLRKIAQD